MELSEVASILEILKEKVTAMEYKIENLENYMVKKDHFDEKISELKSELSEIKDAVSK